MLRPVPQRKAPSLSSKTVCYTNIVWQRMWKKSCQCLCLKDGQKCKRPVENCLQTSPSSLGVYSNHPYHLSPYFALFFYTAPIISWYHITELSFFLHWNPDPMWAPLYTDYLILTIIGFFSELSVPNIPITPLFKNDFGFIKKLQKIELILPLKIRGIGICLEKHSVPFNKLLCLSPPVTLLHFCLANCFLVGSVMKGP
jgi:hypothetical protein